MSITQTFLLFVVVLLLGGCAGAANSRSPRHSHIAGSSSHPMRSALGASKNVAGVTKAVTLKRQGDWDLTSQKVKEVLSLVSKAAKQNNLPEDLILGIIWVESRFNPSAVSPVGARGLMQLMPKTADYLAKCINWEGRYKSFDPAFNIAAGSYYIAKLIKNFDGDVNLALAAYNAGSAKVRRWLKSDGLPKVSIEYHSMVQTARGFFGGGAKDSAIPTDNELDKLGLAVLIAGLSDKEFGLQREDIAIPFN